jgi:hypothetical protein
MNLRKNAPADDVADAPVEESNKRLLVIGGVAAGLAVVAAMSYVLLSGGSEDPDLGVIASPGRTVAAQPSAPPTGAASAPAIKKFTGKNARDPFKALVVEPVAAAAGTGSTSGTTSGTTGTTSGTTTGTTSGTTSGSTTPTVAPTASPTAAPRATDPVTITLVSVAAGDTSANFKLDGTAVKGVKPQATFATYFKLLNLTQGKCGAIQYGDVTFEMCEGDSITLR